VVSAATLLADDPAMTKRAADPGANCQIDDPADDGDSEDNSRVVEVLPVTEKRHPDDSGNEQQKTADE
jgi:hypothetical protein